MSIRPCPVSTTLTSLIYGGIALLILIPLSYPAVGESDSVAEIERLLIEEAFERRQWMIRASHILIAFGSDDAVRDRNAALSKLRAVEFRLRNGEISFERAARLFSDDKLTSETGGDLDYFSVFEHLYPIESAAYETPVGEISPPVKSRFGWHLVKVTERVHLPGKMRAARITIDKSSPDARERIEAIADLARQKPFHQLVEEFSENPVSRNRGGDLGTNRLVTTLQTALLGLSLHEVSEPVQTENAWHLIKLTEITPFTPLSHAANELGQMIRLDRRVDRIKADIAEGNAGYPISRYLLNRGGS